jgi:hypothetical protein
MRAYWESGGIAPRILDLVTRWRRVVSLMPQSLHPQGKSPWYQLIGGLVGPRAGLDAVVEKKIPSRATSAGSRTPDHPARNPVLYH